MQNEFTLNELRFILKVIVESRNIHGQDIEKAVYVIKKLQDKLKENGNV
tara:strand:- start:448 stop:594 length:147 start_codon:yes stop_codon:yes gene_type:complete